MTTSEQVLEGIRAHGERTYPEECCGFLLGATTGDDRTVEEILAVENIQEANRERRFLMGPGDYLKAERYATERGLDIVGTYHSHPDHPARPSETDLAEATFPNFNYVIVSINKGVSRELTAWTLAEDRSRFDSDTIDIHNQIAQTR